MLQLSINELNQLTYRVADECYKTAFGGYRHRWFAMGIWETAIGWQVHYIFPRATCGGISYVRKIVERDLSSREVALKRRNDHFYRKLGNRLHNYLDIESDQYQREVPETRRANKEKILRLIGIPIPPEDQKVKPFPEIVKVINKDRKSVV